MRKSGFTLSINPDKTQHYLSVALFAVKGRGQGWVLRGRESLGIPTSNNQDSLCAQTKSIQPSNGIKTFKGSQDIKPNPEYFISNRVINRVTHIS